MRTETLKLFTAVTSILFVGYITHQTPAHGNTAQPVLEPIAVTAKALPEPEVVVKKPAIDRVELECLAYNIYFEARSESKQGQLAVAHVTLNRVKHRKFPNSVCEVVKQARYSRWWKEHHGRNVPVRNQCQFSWYCDGKSDRVRNMDAWKKITQLSLLVMLNKTEDPTSGATYYYNPALADPYWKDSFEQVALVDNHVFLR